MLLDLCASRGGFSTFGMIKLKGLWCVVVALICSVSAFAAEKRTTTGAVFVRDTSLPALGEAWRDPSGMIWGDMVPDLAGYPYKFPMTTHEKALNYCKSIGAGLPSVKDFTRLREYMGAAAGSANGYKPQVLPNLVYVEKNERPDGQTFWASEIHPKYDSNAFLFNGENGTITHAFRFGHQATIRCVYKH